MALAAATATISLLSGRAWAVSGTWISSVNLNYTNPTAWTFGTAPGGSQDVANFTGVDLAAGSTLHVDVTSLITLGTLVFSDTTPATTGAWLIESTSSNGTLVLNNDTATPIINVGNLGATSTLSFAQIDIPIIVTGSGSGLIKTGVGELRLTQSNDFGGGTISINQGTLTIGTPSHIGNAGAILSLGGGTLSLRNDGTIDLSNYQINVASVTSGNSGLNVDRALGSSLTGQSVVDKIGTVVLAAANTRFAIGGSTNGYGVSIGTLIFQGGGSSSFNNVSPGGVAIGNVVSPSGGTLTFSGTGDATGSDIQITQSVIQTGGAALNVAYTDNHTLTVGSFGTGGQIPAGALTVSGSGTLLVTDSGAVIPSTTLTISDGTLDFSASTLQSTIGTLLMGAGGNSASYIKIASGGLKLNNNATFSAGNSINPSQPGIITGPAGAIFSLSSTATATQTFFVNQILTTTGAPGQDLTINVGLQSIGTMVKSGAGELVLAGSNTATGTFTVNAGTLTSIARQTGSALGKDNASGTLIIQSGNYRLLSAVANGGTASVGNMYFTGDIAPAELIVDASGAAVGDATLNLGIFGTRVSGTGVLTIIPVKGSLNGNEHIHVGAFNAATDPANNHGIVAPFVVTERSGANGALDFISRDANGNLVTATYSAFADGLAGGTAITQAGAGTTNVSGTSSVYALKIGATQAVSGGGSVSIGDGNRAGLILNDGAVINVINLALTAQEAVIWSGGTTNGGTVGSSFGLSGGINNLTTGGPQTLTLAGNVGLGGATRTITVGSGTTVISGNISNGNLFKTGPGVLALTSASNSGFGGTLTVSAGTVSVGVGNGGSLGSGSVNTGNSAIGAGTLQFNLSGTRTITEFITGQGTVLQNNSTGGILVLHSGVPSTYSNLAILNGGVQLSANNDISQGATISVSGGSLDLNGRNQTINALAGGATATSTGLITNSTAALSTLTLNPTSGTNATYSGDIGGTSTMRLVKTGNGTQVLGGNGDYTGGVQITGGTLSAASNTALGHDASVILNNTNGGALRLEGTGPTLPTSLSISISNGTGTVSVGSFAGGINTGTISGPIVGTGTLVINNQNSNSQLTVGTNSLDTMVDPIAGSAGTVVIANGGLRFNAAAGANVGNPSLNFNLSGTGVISTVNVATMRLGRISGGVNTTIAPVTGSFIELGAAGGAQSFNGTITGTNVTLSKVGSGTLTLNSRTSSYSGPTNILGGALVLNNAILSGTPTINLSGGSLIMTGNASISSTAAINLSDTFNFDVINHQGWTTPGSLTVQGTGGIAGRYQHNAGTLAPGGDGTVGSITFNTFDSRNTVTFGDSSSAVPGTAGITLLDFSSVGAIGAGSNDLIKINGDVALNADALFRVNNLNPSTNFVAGQTFAAILYSGNKLTALDSAVNSVFRGSFQLVDMPDPGAFPGYHLIGVEVVSFNATPSISTWTGSVSSTWDLNITKNFKDATGPAVPFYQGDSVVFDNSVLGPNPTAATNKSINLANGAILPGTITFGNTSNLLSYTVQGPGVIGGGAKVVVNGGGTVTFTGDNTYTGGTVVNSGWLVVQGAGSLGGEGPVGIGSVLLNGGASGQNATIAFAANANIANDLYTPAGQMSNIIGVSNGSMQTQGKLFGTFNLASTTNRWDFSTLMQTPADLLTGTLLISATTSIRLLRPYAGAGMFFNFTSGQGSLTSNLFDPMNDSIFVGGLAGVGGGNLIGFNGGEPPYLKQFVIGSANADTTWGGQVTDSFGRAPATGGGSSAYGISNAHAPTAITKTGNATLKFTGVSVLMSGDLTVNQGTMIIDNTDPALGSRAGGGLFVWATRVQVNSGATFQLGSGGTNGLGNYIGDNNSNAGTFLQASSTGSGVLWNANGGTINVSQGYTSSPAISTVNGNTGTVSLNTQYAIDPKLTIAGSNANIYGSVRLTGGTLSPGDGGSGRYGSMTVTGVDNAAMADPAHSLDFANSNYGLEMNGGALVFDIGSATANADNLTINGAGTLGQMKIDAGTGSKIVVNFNGNSAIAGSNYTLAGFGGLSGTFQGANGPKLVLNGRNAAGTLNLAGNNMVLSITTAASASNIQWASSNGTWDVGSWAAGATKNWINLDTANSADYFYHGDNVNFNTSQVAGTVTLGGSVAPNKINVNTVDGTSITFAGQGRITGNASLVKNGNGTLTIRTRNDYSGGTTINTGTLEMGASPGFLYFPGMNISSTGPFFDSNREGDVGTGTVTIAPEATLAYRATRGAHLTNNIVGGGQFVVDVLQGAVRLDTAGSWTGGTIIRDGFLSLGMDNAVPSAGSLSIVTIIHPTVTTATQAGAGGRLDLNEHSQSINELYGNGLYSLVMNEGSLNILNPQTTFSVGSGDFVGALHQGQETNSTGTFSQIAFVKFSPGTLTMNYLTSPTSIGTLGTNITGLSDVKQGMLVIRGVHEPNGVPALSNISSGSYIVRNGATLAGDGTIRSTVSVESGGIIAPGLPDATVHTGGTLTVNALTLNSTALNFGLRGINSDQIDIQANNTLNALGTSTVNINVDNTLVTQPGSYKLIDYRGLALNNFAAKFTLGSVTNSGIFSYNLFQNTPLTEIDLIVSQPAVTSVWNVSTGGSWAVASNWSSFGSLTLAPNSVDSVANLTAPASMSINPTITVDNTVALATLNLATANGHSFTINPIGGGSFSFNTSGSPGVGINVTSGNHVINVPTTFNQDPTINVAASSTLTLQQSLDAAGKNLTKTGSGLLVVGSIRNTSGFNGSADFRIAGGKVQIGTFAPGNAVNGVSKVNTISIDNGAQLDLTNNALVIDYASVPTGTALLASTRALIVSGKIISSAVVDSAHAIGYRDNQGLPLNIKDPAISTGAYRALGAVSDQAGAGGVSVDLTSIVVKYTYKGDTNLDGMVDINDLLNVATHYNQTGGTIAGVGNGWVWQQGDFNNDGNVDISDLQYIGTNWLLGAGSNPGTQLSPLLTTLGLPNVPVGTPAVPEPTLLGLVGIGWAGLMTRQRRRL